MARAKKRATIKDVAAEAGVSYQTVSRVINDHPSVTDKTRTKVQEAIETLGFRPSLAARSLPQRRSFIIGLIVPYEADYLFRDPNLIAQISGIDAEANAQGYNLLLSTAGQSDNGLDAYERFIRNQVADGAIVVETASLQEGNARLARQGYPYVSIGYDTTANACSVHCNDYEGAREATLHLLQKGHRRIGVINGPPLGAIGSMQERLNGYQRALADANIPFDANLVYDGDYTRPSGQTATQHLMALADPPTAIFAFNDRMAMGAVRALDEAGRRVPEDVAVVGFDDITTAGDFNPALTTVRQPAKLMGQIAAQMLFKLIDGQSVDSQERVLPAELVLRKSS
ncbi:MAG: LacI family DNA-binding transcriptional regulator [Anaerolineae bacterium]|nr:LacI family DNA-binding transcriptional regulator [Anaerolineae bacterium]